MRPLMHLDFNFPRNPWTQLRGLRLDIIELRIADAVDTRQLSRCDNWALMFIYGLDEDGRVTLPVRLAAAPTRPFKKPCLYFVKSKV